MEAGEQETQRAVVYHPTNGISRWSTRGEEELLRIWTQAPHISVYPIDMSESGCSKGTHWMSR